MTALEAVADEEWDARLDALGLTDAYLRRGYLRSGAVLTPAQPLLLHLTGAAGDVVFAALRRTEPTDLITPYGYGGPVTAGTAPPVADFAGAYEEWCRACSAVSTFVVFHPLYANQDLDLGFHVEPLTGTIAWELGPDIDLLAGMHRHHRRMVRRALGAGAEVRVAVCAPGDLDALAAFRRLYTETMRRAAADPFYLFADAYWSALAEGVPMVCVEVWQGSEQLAGVLGLTGAPGLAGAPWLHYHLGASSEAGRTLGASHLALYALAGWGQEQGYGRLHLGGGVGGRRDSLFLYKERFAPGGEIPAAIGKAVHDRQRYRELTGQSELSLQGFFPAYRAPH